MEEQVKNKVILSDRKYVLLEGVQYVQRFDENEIILETNMGLLSLKGEGLHITQLDLAKGTLEATGLFGGFNFRESKSTIKGQGKPKAIIGRLFK